MNSDTTLGPFLEDGTLFLARDPAALNLIAAHLLQQLKPLQVGAVACWSGEDEAVLAHAIAAGLGVPVLRAWADQGILTLAGNVNRDVRVAVVATEWDLSQPLPSLLSLLETHGAVPVATVALRSTPQLTELTSMMTVVAEGSA